MGFAAFGGEDAADGMEVEGVGDEGVESVGGDGDDLAAGDGDGGAFEGLEGGLLGIDFDEVGRHVGVAPRGIRKPSV
jgi:hypothetical protein